MGPPGTTVWQIEDPCCRPLRDSVSEESIANHFPNPFPGNRLGHGGSQKPAPAAPNNGRPQQRAGDKTRIRQVVFGKGID